MYIKCVTQYCNLCTCMYNLKVKEDIELDYCVTVSYTPDTASKYGRTVDYSVHKYTLHHMYYTTTCTTQQHLEC